MAGEKDVVVEVVVVDEVVELVVDGELDVVIAVVVLWVYSAVATSGLSWGGDRWILSVSLTSATSLRTGKGNAAAISPTAGNCGYGTSNMASPLDSSLVGKSCVDPTREGSPRVPALPRG